MNRLSTPTSPMHARQDAPRSACVIGLDKVGYAGQKAQFDWSEGLLGSGGITGGFDSDILMISLR